MSKADIGICGVGVMGNNLALNMESKGYRVAAYDVDADKIAALARESSQGRRLHPTTRLEQFVGSLARPRKAMLMVTAGGLVDTVIGQLLPLLEPGDVIVDGGNSYFKDTMRRCEQLRRRGVHYLGTGVSGGEQGALKGPSIMPGGSPEAYALLEPIFTKIAAQVNGEPCCDYIGEDGAGHYVKMTHNGIEYADMQLICEAYSLMRDGMGMSAPQMHQVFAQWQSGDLDSYLIEITADILAKVDPDTGNPLVDVILDQAGQKGTGAWTSQSALELGIPAPTIATAVFARCVSAIKAERVAASRQLQGPNGTLQGNRDELLRAIGDALYASKVCAYAQGFALLRGAAQQYGWQLDYGKIAAIWRGGCIIRAQLLDRIKDAFTHDPDLPNLLLFPYFKQVVQQAQDGWRRTVATAAELGIPVMAFSSALNYYDSYRSPRLCANLLQAQRDYFGAHTYRRVDKDGVFHTDWSKP
jgi:6-phosphogluconate dehydrogenase